MKPIHISIKKGREKAVLQYAEFAGKQVGTSVPKISEKAFMRQIVQLAGLCGWFVYHTHDSRRSTKGFPDILLLKGPRIVVAELKVGRNKLTPEQESWLAAFRLVPGAEVFEWRETDWDLIERVLA